MTAAARERSAAATARSAPGSTSRAASARRAPSSASARAAGGSPSCSASACSSARTRSRTRAARSTRARALALGAPRCLCSTSRLELEAGEIALPLGLGGRGRRLGAEPLEQRGRRLGPELEPLDAALQPVARRNRGLAPTRRVRELLLGPRPIGEQPLEPSLRSALRERCGVSTLLGLRATRARVGEVELRDPRAQAGDLDAELLGALRGRRLQRERPQALAHLLLDVARALDLERDAGELQLGAMTAALELPEPGRLLHERAPILRPRGEHLLDLALADDRVHRRAEPDVREDLDEIGAPHGRAVDEVLPFGTAHEPPRDRHLGELEIRPRAVLVVEDELDLTVLRRPCGRPLPRRGRRPASRREARTASASPPPRRSRRRCSTCPSRSARR